MNKTLKTEEVEGSWIASSQSIWRRIARLFRDNHNPLLVANVTAFNEPRLYFPPDFSPPLRLVLSRL